MKLLLLQQWYTLSDPGLEEAADDRLSFRRVAGLPLDEGVPKPQPIRPKIRPSHHPRRYAKFSCNLHNRAGAQQLDDKIGTGETGDSTKRDLHYYFSLIIGFLFLFSSLSLFLYLFVGGIIDMQFHKFSAPINFIIGMALLFAYTTALFHIYFISILEISSRGTKILEYIYLLLSLLALFQVFSYHKNIVAYFDGHVGSEETLLRKMEEIATLYIENDCKHNKKFIGHYCDTLNAFIKATDKKSKMEKILEDSKFYVAYPVVPGSSISSVCSVSEA